MPLQAHPDPPPTPKKAGSANNRLWARCVQPLCCAQQLPLRDLAKTKLMPPGKYCRKRHGHSLRCRTARVNRSAKVRKQVACPLQLPEPGIFGPLSRVKVCRRSGGSSRQHGGSALSEALLLWALAGSRKRLLRPLQLTKVALAPCANQNPCRHGCLARIGHQLLGSGSAARAGKASVWPWAHLNFFSK